MVKMKHDSKHKPVGQVLRSIRIEKQLNQATLERRSGVSQQVISALERGGGRECSFYIVRQLALALGVTIDEISRRMGPIPHGNLDACNPREFHNLGHPPYKAKKES